MDYLTKGQLFGLINLIRAKNRIDESRYPLNPLYLACQYSNLEIEFFYFKNKRIGGLFMRGKKEVLSL